MPAIPPDPHAHNHDRAPEASWLDADEATHLSMLLRACLSRPAREQASLCRYLAERIPAATYRDTLHLAADDMEEALATLERTSRELALHAYPDPIARHR